MRFRKLAAGIVLGLGILMCIAWVRFSRLNRETEARLAKVTAESAQLAAAQAKWTDRLAQARVAQSSVQPTAAINAGPVKNPPVSKRRSVSISSMVVVETLLKDPKLAARFLTAQKANLAALYGSFFRSRGLSSDQAAALAGLVAQREAQTLDIAAASPRVAAALWQSRWMAIPILLLWQVRDWLTR